MIDSPARKLHHILLALTVFALPFAVTAQPLDLSRQDPSPATRPASPAEDKQEDTEIIARTLEAVDPDEYGLIGTDEGALGLDMWKGVDWPFVKVMMARMPGVTTAAAIRNLSSRLLLSGGKVPSDKPQSESFAALRIDRLLALADTESTLQLIKAIPPDQRSDEFTAIEADTLFLHNRNAEGCAAARSVTERSGAAYWRQALSFCFTLDGNYMRAGMIADLLRERDDDVDPAFFDIIDALGGLEGVEISSISDPTGLILAMIRASSLRVPEALGTSGTPSILRWIARTPNADIDLRVYAAERSLVNGLISAGEILRIYGGVPFTPDELTDPITHAACKLGTASAGIAAADCGGRDIRCSEGEYAAARTGTRTREGGISRDRPRQCPDRLDNSTANRTAAVFPGSSASPVDCREHFGRPGVVPARGRQQRDVGSCSGSRSRSLAPDRSGQ